MKHPILVYLLPYHHTIHSRQLPWYHEFYKSPSHLHISVEHTKFFEQMRVIDSSQEKRHLHLLILHKKPHIISSHRLITSITVWRVRWHFRRSSPCWGFGSSLWSLEIRNEYPETGLFCFFVFWTLLLYFMAPPSVEEVLLKISQVCNQQIIRPPKQCSSLSQEQPREEYLLHVIVRKCITQVNDRHLPSSTEDIYEEISLDTP